MPPGFTDVMSSPSQGAGSERFSDLYPLTFGKIVAPVTIPIEVESLGISMVGVYDMVGEVDAWGKVAVPAGTFDALRLYVHGEGEVTIGMEDEEPVTFVQSIDQWAWMAPRVGQIVMTQQVTTEFPALGDEFEAVTFTQVVRLSDFGFSTTAITAASWGARKEAMFQQYD